MNPSMIDPFDNHLFGLGPGKHMPQGKVLRGAARSKAIHQGLSMS